MHLIRAFERLLTVARAQPGSSDPLSSTFDMVRIISLADRHDRRKDVFNTLRRLGLTVGGHSCAFFDAVRPSDPDGFPSIGARGCFMSHLEVLRAARTDGVEALLILEDDVEFSRSEVARMSATLAALAAQSWDIFYGGSPATPRSAPLTDVPPTEGVQQTHFIAFSKRAIDMLVPYLEAMLNREPGSPDGGPMHVDGAYSWFRQQHPDIRAYAATPHIAHQRSSRTDIDVLGSTDTNAVLQPFLQVARTIKNAIRSRN